MTDLIDRAQEREQIDRDLAIEAARGPFARLGDTPWETATECLECGEILPEARRQAVPGVMLCCECQRKQELRGKRYA